MSTRGLIGIHINGEDYGFYNHSDSYPDGLGVEVIKFVRENLGTPSAREMFKRNFLAMTPVVSHDTPTQEEFNYYLEVTGRDIGGGLGLDRAKSEYYTLLRSFQGVDGLEAIMNGTLKHRIDDVEFIKDSLFCEYAYFLNFDTGVVEFYKGWQKFPDPTNRFGITKDGDREYYPCRKVYEASFSVVSPQNLREYFPGEDDE